MFAANPEGAHERASPRRGRTFPGGTRARKKRPMPPAPALN